MTVLDRGANAVAVLATLFRSQATIDFDFNGKILTANKNFCRVLGFDLVEIIGKHPSMFVDQVSIFAAEDPACGGYKVWLAHQR